MTPTARRTGWKAKLNCSNPRLTCCRKAKPATVTCAANGQDGLSTAHAHRAAIGTAYHSISAKSLPRRLAYLASILGSLWPVILAICKSLKLVRSNNRLVASCRRSWNRRSGQPAASNTLANCWESIAVVAFIFSGSPSHHGKSRLPLYTYHVAHFYSHFPQRAKNYTQRTIAYKSGTRYLAAA